MTIPNKLDKETFKAHEHYPFKARSHQNPNRGEITKETNKSTFYPSDSAISCKTTRKHRLNPMIVCWVSNSRNHAIGYNQENLYQQ